MKYIKLFLEERRGVGIVEYVLLLALLGTVVSVTVPPVREQIGIMYNNQANNGDNFVGGIDSNSATRIEINTPAPITVSLPNTSEENTGDMDRTPDFTPPDFTPEQKTVIVEVKKSSNDFDAQITYDQEGFYGVLNKRANGLSQTVIGENSIAEELEYNDPITKDSISDFDDLEQYETTVGDFSGTMFAVSDIRQVLVQSDTTSGTVTKPSGNVVLSRETQSTDMSYVNSLFPSAYDYVEVDPSNETETGYTGTLSKLNTPQRFTIGTSTTTDTRTETTKRFVAISEDVTSSYSNGDFTTPPMRTNLFSSSINYSTPDGYTGTLSLSTSSIVRTLENVSTNNILDGTVSHRVYSSGTFTSSSNTKTYSSSYNYDDGNGRTGVLGSPVNGSIFSHSDQAQRTQRSYGDYPTNSIPNTFNYNSGGYSGTLPKSGSATVISGSLSGTSSSKTVTVTGSFWWGEICNADGSITYVDNKMAPSTMPYNQDGFSGSLSLDFWNEGQSLSNQKCNGVNTARDELKYSYTGTVTKPATDTRIWRQYYEGTVYGPNVDYYNHYATYSGNVYKKQYIANYSYEADYSGQVSKTVNVTDYRYDQTYSGTLSKNSYNFTYQYSRDYAGTLFKTTTQDIIEYTQEYEGTVTEQQ